MIPIKDVDVDSQQLKKPFGIEWKSLFYLTSRNLNHGSSGAIPIAILNKRNEISIRIESDPDYFIRYQAESEIKEFLSEIAEIISAEKSDIFPISSASDAANAFYKSLDWKKGDKIFFYSAVYGMTRQLFNFLQEKYEVEPHECVLTTQIIAEESSLIEFTKEFIAKNGPFKVVNLEHIGCNPSFIYPLKKLISLFKENSEKSVIFVDGAHAIGNIPINIQEFSISGYVSNLHKWMYTPRGTAFLYLSKEIQQIIHSNIISLYFKDSLLKEFIFPCTIDYSNWLAGRTAIQWRKVIGEDKIQEFTHKIAWEAGKAVARIWGTQLLIEKKERLASMVNVECYGKIKKEEIGDFVKKFKEIKGTFLQIFWFDGKCFVRLSGQIYNYIAEYEEMAREFMEFYKERNH